MAADTGHSAESSRRRRPIILAIALLVLVLVGCTTDPDPSTPLSETSQSPRPVPDVPQPSDPVQPGPDADDLAEGSAPVPGQVAQAGEETLLHLEGPLGNGEATDVVLRTAAGQEIDRFRLPGAVGVWAAPDSSQALIYTLSNSWARYDATTGRLTPVGFPGEAPGPTIRAGNSIAGPTAIWDSLDARWLLRMDSGMVTDLESQLGASRVDTLARTGDYAILEQSEGPVVLTTGTADLRRLDGAATAGMTSDGSRVATLGSAGEAREVALQQIDGTARQVIGTTATATGVVPMADGRVILLGPEPGIMGADGIVAPFTPPASIGRPVRLSNNETAALVSTGTGLAVVDLIGLTTTPIPASGGFIPLELGPASVLWAASVDPQRPGALVVDPDTLVVTRFLDDRPTERFLSITTAGDRVSMAVGGEGFSTVVVDSDGTVTPLLVDTERAEAYLHPDGEIVATSRIGREDQELLVGPMGGEPVVIPTGRNPVWLSTVSAQGRPVPDDGTPQGRPNN